MKLSVLLIAILLGSALFGSKIDEFASHMGYYRDYDKALEQAKKENKTLFIVQVSDYCPWCRKFERKTLQYVSIAIKINQNFIPLVIDRGLDKGKYPQKYYSDRIPTTYFVSPKNENIIQESVGYVKKKDFTIILDDFLLKHGARK